ncbi:3-oxoadipate enol-lactonase [Arcticibacterium luteifluviistationis]|uniref:3-oxoadipate enol-lactonase n=1 Tax=Arcticibacterium luteifluviistationis TaxID=1784714 RepID=A0A2Z4GHL9_9BACT|nr:3-oxoadipate enol-lactonase [Arcticibacterium luteifluviistationis]AWW00429.1 3-oxoadipate enol-lactonase [Arcticibacterium luteifluviistationis]
MKTSYKIQGAEHNPVLIFSNSLGTEMMMWDALVPYLLPYFRVLQYDTRGHGGSDKPEGNYSIELLAGDVIAVMDKLNIDKAYFCGLSMGGLIGQWLGINNPERFYKLALSNTGAKVGDDKGWNERISSIQNKGMQAIADGSSSVWFTDDFVKKQPKQTAAYKEMLLRANVGGYCSCSVAIRDVDFRENLDVLKVPTLVITGEQDPVTTAKHATFLVENIPDASLVLLPARHLSASELPKEFADVLIKFFTAKPSLS